MSPPITQISLTRSLDAARPAVRARVNMMTADRRQIRLKMFTQ